MLGNVWEWCADGYRPDYSTPQRPGDTLPDLIHGGSFRCGWEDCRAARRRTTDPPHIWTDLGLRVVCDLPLKPLSPQEAKQRQEDAAKQVGVPMHIENSIGMKLNLIPAGSFLMGSPEDEPGRRANEGPRHAVRIGRPFYLGTYEVTQREYKQVGGANPSTVHEGAGGGPDYPVESVSWQEAGAFCEKLSALDGEKGAHRVYRLPTEAEWEYACRAGTLSAYGFGDNPAGLGDFGWWPGNDGGRSHPVGRKKPNAWGLYDMHGNVWEWCGDVYEREYYRSSPMDDPQGPKIGKVRVIRGGGYANGNPAAEFRSANRWPDWDATIRQSNVGFRVVCEVPPKP